MSTLPTHYAHWRFARRTGPPLGCTSVGASKSLPPKRGWFRSIQAVIRTRSPCDRNQTFPGAPFPMWVGQEWVRERGTQEHQQTGGGATQTHGTREPHQEGRGRAQQTRKRGAARLERQPGQGTRMERAHGRSRHLCSVCTDHTDHCCLCVDQREAYPLIICPFHCWPNEESSRPLPACSGAICRAGVGVSASRARACVCVNVWLFAVPMSPVALLWANKARTPPRIIFWSVGGAEGLNCPALHIATPSNRPKDV